MSQLLLRRRSRWVPVVVRQCGLGLGEGGSSCSAAVITAVAAPMSMSGLLSSPSSRPSSSFGPPLMSSTTTVTAPGWAIAVITSSTESPTTTRSHQLTSPSVRGRHLRYYHSSSASSSRGEYYKLRHHKKAAQPCPFEVLGLPRHGKKKEKKKAMDTTSGIQEVVPGDDDTHPSHDIDMDNNYDEDGAVRYRAVKAAFLRIAMAHHPDTTTAETQEELDAHRDVFIAAREAFEQIVSGANGVAVLRSESPDHAANGSDEGGPPLDVDAWFQSQTGHSMPFMDLQTMREVAKMTETVGHGLDRDGGMWLLAEMVSDSVKKGGSGDGASILRLEAGDASNGSRSGAVDGILRRRRKRDR